MGKTYAVQFLVNQEVPALGLKGVLNVSGAVLDVTTLNVVSVVVMVAVASRFGFGTNAVWGIFQIGGR